MVRAPRQLVFSPNLTQLTGFARRPAERLPHRRSRSLPTTTTATLARIQCCRLSPLLRPAVTGGGGGGVGVGDETGRTSCCPCIIYRGDADTASALLFSHTASAIVCVHIILYFFMYYIYYIL